MHQTTNSFEEITQIHTSPYVQNFFDKHLRRLLLDCTTTLVTVEKWSKFET